MTDETMPPIDDLKKAWKSLRESVAIQAGGVFLAEAQLAYFNRLKEGGMDEETAFSLLAHTTDSIMRSVAGALPGVAEVALRIVAEREAAHDA